MGGAFRPGRDPALEGRPRALSAERALIPHDAAAALLGSLLCVSGLAFAVWARLTLGRNWSSAVTLKLDHELVRRGPYGLVRHPIYTGLLAMVLGTAIVDGHLAGVLAVALFFAGVWVKARQEETLMLNEFPNEYPAYRQRVKRSIPRLF